MDEEKPKRARKSRSKAAAYVDPETGEPDYAAFLDSLTWDALKKWEQVVKMKVPRTHRQYVRLATIQERAANNIVRASILLGAQRLKRRQTDKLQELLAEIRRAGHQPPLLEAAAQRVQEAVLEPEGDQVAGRS
jgi:hypothetical protein